MTQAKSVITKSLIALAYLVWICGTVLCVVNIGLLLQMATRGVPTLSLIILAVVTWGCIISGGIALIVIFQRIKKSSYYSLSKHVVIRQRSSFKDDSWFYICFTASLISTALAFGSLFWNGEYSIVFIAIAVLFALLGVFLNVCINNRLPVYVAVCSGFVVLQMVKLIQLLEENDGKVCLACRHVLGPQALHGYQCPECGKPVEGSLRAK